MPELWLGFKPEVYWPWTRGADSPLCTWVSIALSFSLMSTLREPRHHGVESYKKELGSVNSLMCVKRHRLRYST